MIGRMYRILRRLNREYSSTESERRRGGDRRQLADRREDSRCGEQLASRRQRERRLAGNDVRSAS